MEVPGRRRAVEVLGRGRLGRACLVTCVVLLAGSWLAAKRSAAAGDANDASCPTSTESSPGFRASLPDCRAYEIVSEANSGDLTNVTGTDGFPDGEHVAYSAFLPTPGEAVRNGEHESILATRSSSGWRQQAVSVPQGEGPTTELTAAVETEDVGVVFGNDFTEAFLMSPFKDPFEVPQMDQTIGETTNISVYRLSLDTGAASVQSLPDSGGVTQAMIEAAGCTPGSEVSELAGCGSFLAGASTDGSRVFFVSEMSLPTAIGTPQDTHQSGDAIYERYAGHTYLVSVLPDGRAATCGASVGQGVRLKGESRYSYGAVAPSGNNVVFSASDCTTTGLYLREVLDGTTVKLPGAIYTGRAGTGSGQEEVVFTSGEGKFYEYHIKTGHIDEFGEGGIGLLAYSPNGARVYFLGPEEALYEWQGGKTKLVPGTQAGRYHPPGAVEGGGYIRGGGETLIKQFTANMPVASGSASEGAHLLFIDAGQVTSYPNEGHTEAYVYDAEDGRVTCISCNPTGAPPKGNAEQEQGNTWLTDEATIEQEEGAFHPVTHPYISNDGDRAVFETTEALVPQDVNSTMDVYEWQRGGTSGCTGASATYSQVIEGCIYLLSSGLGREILNPQRVVNGTHLVGASEDIHDIYMRSSESLLPGLDNAFHIYDARVEGGFPYAPTTRGCEASQCEPAIEGPPAVLRPATATFTGLGNLKSSANGPASGSGRHDTRALKLRVALEACRRIKDKDRKRRARCVRRARRRYGARAVRFPHAHHTVLRGSK